MLTETVCLALRKMHQQRYEEVRNWRERQEYPYFTEVDDRWREKFERLEAGEKSNPPASGLTPNA
ncbi:hypothetical protein FACS1894170_01910 [Planctomycetales bacterium]|nr:hypothetical protein FACS1894170_01910 [Planctomycetales bacterium]